MYLDYCISRNPVMPFFGELTFDFMRQILQNMGYLGFLGRYTYTSSTAQGGGGSFKNRKRIGEIDCCE